MTGGLPGRRGPAAWAVARPRPAVDVSRLSLAEADALMWELAARFRDAPPSYAVHCYEQGQLMVLAAATYASTRAKWVRGWRL